VRLYVPLNKKLLTWIALILILLSGILFGLIFVVPFLPFSLSQKGIIFTALVIGMEITWWVGVAIIGKQVITKYKKYLNPCYWFSRRKKIPEDNEQ
jgi:hypothetical protein